MSNSWQILSKLRRTIRSFCVVIALLLSLCVTNLGYHSPAGAVSFHTVTFNENLHTGTSLIASQVSSSSTSLTLYSNLTPSFLYPGFAFKNWNTNLNGSGTTYDNGATYNFSSDLILYAQWIPTNHIVTFNENRNLNDSAYSVQIKATQAPLTLFANLSPVLSNPGYSFSSWNTKANGLGVRYTNGQLYSFASDLTLYAQWVKSTAALNFVGSVPSGPALPALNAVATQILNRHYHQVEVVQFRHQDGAAVLGLLTKILVTHDGPGITVALRRSSAESQTPGVEVFAN